MSNNFDLNLIMDTTTAHIGWGRLAGGTVAIGPRISQGAGVPTEAVPQGTLYLRNDGISGLFQRRLTTSP